MKKKTQSQTQDYPILGTLLLVVMLFGVWPVLNFVAPTPAKAEVACPAPVPSTYMTVRTGSPTGPIVADLSSEPDGDQENSTYASIDVPSGTVLYYSNHTADVELTNRSLGSVHSYSSAATVTAPSTKAGYYPSGYYFTKQNNISGYTNPLTSDATMNVGAYNSCWGGFEDGISNTSLSIHVAGTPQTISRQSESSLAIVRNPSVNLQVNGSTSATVSAGGTATFSWTTDSVNVGNSCEASNTNSDSTWTGSKLGQASFTPPNPAPPSGGSQTVGPFPTVGSFNYSIICYGLNNVASIASTVQVNVGNPPTYTCAATPGSQTVYVGSSGNASIAVTPLNGYSNPVSFSLGSITPSGANAPTVSIGKDPIYPNYKETVPVTISTSASTTPNTYSIVFTGTDGVSCPAITFIVLNPTPDGEIRCDGQLTSCTKSAGQSATITWSSAYVTSCDVSHNPPAIDWSGTSGSQSSGSLSASRVYYLTCTGPYGNINKSVNVTVIGALDAPAWVQGNPSNCGEILVTWGPPSSGANPSYYSVYRRLSDSDPGTPGNQPGPQSLIADNITVLSYPDTTVVINTLYDYGVAAVYGSTPSSITWSAGVSASACEASFDGSYKKIVGAGTAVPSFSRCSGTGGAYDLGANQIFESGDIVYFEICVINSGNVDLTNVTVSEDLPEDQNIENVQFVNAEGGCATGSGEGPYTIGNMPSTNPDTACSILVRATISNPGGPASSLHYFTNYAQLSSNQVSLRVNSPPTVFIIGGDVPDRTETPR